MSTLSLAGKTKTDQSSIDLTPMLDVVFILLIFFVVTASFLKESTLSFNAGQNDESSRIDTPSDNILIQIGSDNQVFINGSRVEISAVKAHISQHLAEYKNASVLINPNKGSIANSLVLIMNSAREAGAVTVSVIE
jgi:biopolymer transport protein ExbD